MYDCILLVASTSMPHLLEELKKSLNLSYAAKARLFCFIEGVERVVFAPATLNTLYVPYSQSGIGVNRGGGCQGGAATLLTDSNQLQPHKGDE